MMRKLLEKNSSRWVDRRAWQPGARIDERGGANFFQTGLKRNERATGLAHVASTDAVLRRMMSASLSWG